VGTLESFAAEKPIFFSTMVLDAEALVNAFLTELRLGGFMIDRDFIKHEMQPAPHLPHGLPRGAAAVY